MDADPLYRATAYPYAIPETSYVLVDGRHEALRAARLPDLAGRRPVLACGSNQAPAQLAYKYRDGNWGPIPVIRAWLRDFDAVYSSHFSSYGAIPATLQHAPGARLSLFITWLTPDQEARMHETEMGNENYVFGRLDGIDLAMDGGGVFDHAFVYLSRRGALILDGAPVALAAIPAEGRIWPEMDQQAVQTRARDHISPGYPLHAFIRETVSHADIRRRRDKALQPRAQPFAYSGFVPIAV